MKWTPALVALHLSLASTMASANQEVHDYLMACREAKAVSSPAPSNSPRTYQAAYCLGTTLGVVDTLKYMDEFLSRQSRLCLPEFIEPAHLVDIVLAYRERKPSAQRLGVARMVRAALKDRYPCPKKTNTL